MNALAERQPPAALVENVIVRGDLSGLKPEERIAYYKQVCESVGLNPLTKPFEYLTLNNKLVLYARRDATDQLRSVHNVSVTDMEETVRDGVYVVTVKVQNAQGRTDMAKGAVNIANLKGEVLANALMKAETKAKRRATLSICGLGFLDETEVETIHQGAAPANGNGPKRTQAEISNHKKWRESELERIKTDIWQIESLIALARYRQEVLTTELMAKLGTSAFAVEQWVGEREAELKAVVEAAGGDSETGEIEELTEEKIATVATDAIRDQMIDMIDNCDTAEQLHRLGNTANWKDSIAVLPDAYANTVRRHWAAKLKKVPAEA